MIKSLWKRSGIENMAPRDVLGLTKSRSSNEVIRNILSYAWKTLTDVSRSKMTQMKKA